MRENRIVVAHPLQQHSYRTALVLSRINWLFGYATTIYYEKGRFVFKILDKVLSGSNATRMRARRNEALDKYIVRFNELLGLVYLFIIRLDKNKIIEPLLYDLLVRKFAISIFKYIKTKNVSAVVMYDTTAYECFKRLKNSKNNAIKILDMSSAAAPYIRKIILKEIQTKTPFADSMKLKLKSYTEAKCDRHLKELQDSDYLFAPSFFVKKSLLYCGVKEEKIINVPYGVDTDYFQQKAYTAKKSSDKLKLLFVGRVEPAKGIYYLLEALKELSNINIELTVVGSNQCSVEELNGYQENVIFTGPIMKSEMSAVYKSTDVFIMPSLWEGMCLSVLEAMSSGVPVIGSESSGAETLIINYKNGFVVKACSVKSITEKIRWCNDNRDRLAIMGKNARVVAEKYSWENYNKTFTSQIRKIVRERSGNPYSGQSN